MQHTTKVTAYFFNPDAGDFSGADNGSCDHVVVREHAEGAGGPTTYEFGVHLNDFEAYLPFFIRFVRKFLPNYAAPVLAD